MTRQRYVLVLIVVPAIVAVLVTLLVLNIWDRRSGADETVIMLPTHSATSQVQPRATAPIDEESPAADDGGDEGDAIAESGGDEGSDAPQDTPAPTIDPSCENPEHIVASGDLLSTIAEQYDVPMEAIAELNAQLDETFDENFLSIGQVLVIPACGIPTPTPTVTPSATLVPTRSVPSPIPTSTDAPQGAIEVAIARVLNPGDITNEAVEIVNNGSPVDLEGWELTNLRGASFTFPSFRLFSGGGVTVYTGAGEDTPIDLYWGRDSAVWRAGDTVTLLDDQGEVHAEFEIEAGG